MPVEEERWQGLIIQLHDQQWGLFAEACVDGSKWVAFDDGFWNKHPVEFSLTQGYPTNTKREVCTHYLDSARRLLFKSKGSVWSVAEKAPILEKGQKFVVRPGMLVLWWEPIKHSEECDASGII